jgi:hypothetical protein
VEVVGAVRQFDFSKLRGRIVEKFGTLERFAEAGDHSKGWISNRMNNVVPWDCQEIDEACEMLDINPEEIPAYFFTLKVL